MYGYIYLTTNLINNMKYIGQHKGTKLDTHYFGSGDLIQRALSKYGKKNFSCNIIDTAQTAEELNQKEIYWINFYDAVNSKMFYNIARGGYIEGRKLGHEVSESTRRKLRLANLGKKLSEETKRKMSLSQRGKHVGDANNAKLEKSRAKLKIANHGENNPAYGKHWYNNGIITVYAYTCPDGFKPGRGNWYNNGINEVFANKCPDGYSKGRLV